MGVAKKIDLVPLSNANLDTIGSAVRVPTYDRSGLTPGIVHIGLGNFHRAHQAWYLHRLMEKGLAHDWAIIGASVRDHDIAQRERLLAQDCLTTLIELDPSGASAEICGSMIDYVAIEEGNQSLIAQMADPAIRIVSLTVTEGGYFIDPATGEFDPNHPDIVHDKDNPDTPRTAFGAIIAALKIRRDAGHGPFTGLSCDNLQGNGEILHGTVLALAQMIDPELAAWIDENCTFPNSMVDCIVPATGSKELELVKQFGINDAVPVTHENFRQWVIEDKFCAGRPDWGMIGATFAKGVHDYEAMKLRVLNGGHQIIAVPGDLLGIETISGTMVHADIGAFLRKTVVEEIAPNVDPVPNMDPLQYLELISGRFANSEIIDTTRRVAFDGSSRQPGFIVPSIRDALDNGQPVDGLALMSALWMVYCRGERADGSLIEPNDPQWNDLNPVATAARSKPVVWIEQKQFYGDLAEEERFVEAFEKWANAIDTNGVAGAIAAYVSD